MSDCFYLAVGCVVTFLTLVAGCVFTWLVSRHYYCRSSKQLPNWADEFAGRLPAYPPKPSHLLKLFQEYLESRDAKIHDLLGIVACPECGTSAALFKEEFLGGDERVCVVSVNCPSCEWSRVVEV